MRDVTSIYKFIHYLISDGLQSLYLVLAALLGAKDTAVNSTGLLSALGL
jgi:hypothetical protein